MSEIVKKDEAIKPRPGSQPIGLAAKKKMLAEKAAKAQLDQSQNVDTQPLFTDPDKMPDRIGIGFDDSGSMVGNKIIDAHTGIEEFLRSSNPRTTAVAVYPMNAYPIPLSVNLPQIAKNVKNIHATGGTPAINTLRKLISAHNLTRAILFSDGDFSMYGWEEFMEAEDVEYDWSSSHPSAVTGNKNLVSGSLLTVFRERKVPCDTVFIGSKEHTSAIANLKKIAEDTGGIFMLFEPGKTNFARAFKYLSPGLRLQLMDRSFKEKVERGEI